jgi:hypothetical protein
MSKATPSKPLTGPELIQKVKDLGNLNKESKARECGYFTQTQNGIERVNMMKFLNALIDAAEGVELDSSLNGQVILTLEEVRDNSENQPNEENQKESAPVANAINIPEKHELNIWQRGNRMIVFASGCSFFGGLVGQLPGALIGAIAGAVYGSILKLETDSPN